MLSFVVSGCSFGYIEPIFEPYMIQVSFYYYYYYYYFIIVIINIIIIIIITIIYYIDTSVLLENVPLVKFLKTTSGT